MNYAGKKVLLLLPDVIYGIGVTLVARGLAAAAAPEPDVEAISFHHPFWRACPIEISRGIEIVQRERERARVGLSTCSAMAPVLADVVRVRVCCRIYFRFFSGEGITRRAPPLCRAHALRDYHSFSTTSLRNNPPFPLPSLVSHINFRKIGGNPLSLDSGQRQRRRRRLESLRAGRRSVKPGPETRI